MLEYTFGNLREMLRARLQDKNANIWSNSVLNANLNYALARIHRIANSLMDYDLDYYTIETSSPTNGSTYQEYSLNNNISKIKAVYHQGSTGISSRLEYLDTHSPITNESSTVATHFYIRDSYYTEYNNNNASPSSGCTLIGFIPRPSANGIKYVVEYLKTYTFITDDDTMPNVPNEFIELVIAEAMMRCYAERGMPTQFMATKHNRDELIQEFINTSGYYDAFIFRKPISQDIKYRQ